MMYTICTRSHQGKSQWQRLLVATRQRNEFSSATLRGSKSALTRQPNSRIYNRDCSEYCRGFSNSSPLFLRSALLRLNYATRLAVGPRRLNAKSRSRQFSEQATKKSETASEANAEEYSSYFGVLLQRLALSLGIVYIVTEYGIEWTVCEGPSMMPTIKPRGEIVLMDRLTPRLLGLSGGDTIEKREAFVKVCQEQHVQDAKRQQKQQREWLLRLYQEEEARLRKNQESQNTEEVDKQSTEEQSTGDEEEIDENQSMEIALRELREDLERRSNDTDDEETWYETRIPVDKLPPEGAWDRFRTQVTTGISVGDVVVIQHPDRIGTVCKRVMGLPGDIVTKPSSRLGANRVDDLLYGESGKSSSQGRSWMFAESEEERTRLHQRTKRRLLSAGVQVPDGHIWVEGDNPWNSSDSRNYGAVPASLIMGRVLLRLWPLRGRALMERGSRPMRSDSDESSMTFSGSIVVPLGWDDQRILREPISESNSPGSEESLAKKPDGEE